MQAMRTTMPILRNEARSHAEREVQPYDVSSSSFHALAGLGSLQKKHLAKEDDGGGERTLALQMRELRTFFRDVEKKLRHTETPARCDELPRKSRSRLRAPDTYFKTSCRSSSKTRETSDRKER